MNCTTKGVADGYIASSIHSVMLVNLNVHDGNVNGIIQRGSPLRPAGPQPDWLTGKVGRRKADRDKVSILLVAEGKLAGASGTGAWRTWIS